MRKRGETELPALKTRRWTIRRKAAVLQPLRSRDTDRVVTHRPRPSAQHAFIEGLTRNVLIAIECSKKLALRCARQARARCQIHEAPIYLAVRIRSRTRAPRSFWSTSASR